MNETKIDPKIQALMAVIDSKTEGAEKLEESKTKLVPPPTTYEEFIKQEKIVSLVYKLCKSIPEFSC